MERRIEMTGRLRRGYIVESSTMRLTTLTAPALGDATSEFGACVVNWKPGDVLAFLEKEFLWQQRLAIVHHR